MSKSDRSSKIACNSPDTFNIVQFCGLWIRIPWRAITQSLGNRRSRLPEDDGFTHLGWRREACIEVIGLRSRHPSFDKRAEWGLSIDEDKAVDFRSVAMRSADQPSFALVLDQHA